MFTNIKFKISSYKSKKYFWVFVHNNYSNFRKGIKIHNKRRGQFYRYQGEIGMCHTFEKFKVENRKIKLMNNIGIIRLSADKLFPSCVYHEIIHAALWQFRLKHRKQANFGTLIDKKEEEFAHIYDQLLKKTVKGLYRYKLWK